MSWSGRKCHGRPPYPWNNGGFIIRSIPSMWSRDVWGWDEISKWLLKKEQPTGILKVHPIFPNPYPWRLCPKKLNPRQRPCSQRLSKPAPVRWSRFGYTYGISVLQMPSISKTGLLNGIISSRVTVFDVNGDTPWSRNVSLTTLSRNDRELSSSMEGRSEWIESSSSRNSSWVLGFFASSYKQ